MNQEEIKKILPHRDHMLLIDEAELREGKAYGKKTINSRLLSNQILLPSVFILCIRIQ